MTGNVLEITDKEIAEAVEPPVALTANGMGVRHSATIGKMAGALAQAQTEFKPVLKDANNPYYNTKYADLASVIAATQPALSKNGLVIVQSPQIKIAEQQAILITMLIHSSGEWIANDLILPATMLGKDKVLRFDAQSVGAAISYARRYAYQSIVCVAAEDDDDGNSVAPQQQAPQHRPHEGTFINAPQKAAFWDACQKHNKTKEDVLRYFGQIGIERTEEMLKKDFPAAMKWAGEAQ